MLLGYVEKAKEASLAGERVDRGKKILQAVKISRAFDGLQGFAPFVAGVVPAPGDGRSICGRV